MHGWGSGQGAGLERQKIHLEQTSAEEVLWATEEESSNSPGRIRDTSLEEVAFEWTLKGGNTRQKLRDSL